MFNKNRGRPEVFTLTMRNEDGQVREHMERRFGPDGNHFLDFFAAWAYGVLGFLGGIMAIGILRDDQGLLNASVYGLALYGAAIVATLFIINRGYRFDPERKE